MGVVTSISQRGAGQAVRSSDFLEGKEGSHRSVRNVYEAHACLGSCSLDGVEGTSASLWAAAELLPHVMIERRGSTVLLRLSQACPRRRGLRRHCFNFGAAFAVRLSENIMYFL